MKKLLFLIFAKILLAQTLVIYSGITMKYPVKEMAAKFEKMYPGLKVKTLFGKSGALYRKMVAMKKCDIYFPGSAKFINKNPKIFLDTAKIGENTLVIIVKKGNPKKIKNLDSLTNPQISVVIGSKNSSVGVKTRDVLKKKGAKFYNLLTKKAIIAYTSNEIIANVISNADSGLNWKGVVYWKNYKQYVDIIPIDKKYSPSSDLVMGVTQFAPNMIMAKRFLKFAKSYEGQKIMRKWGF
ncbi:molybdate ABC transporter substrate-binding protein [Caminibacter pacificus]